MPTDEAHPSPPPAAEPSSPSPSPFPSPSPSAPAISASGRVDLPVAHGRLEALLKEPAHPRRAAVVCHPHPKGGGTMNNNVVYRTARALQDRGTAVLRFNFRGVGRSTGVHGGGPAELED